MTLRDDDSADFFTNTASPREPTLRTPQRNLLAQVDAYRDISASLAIA